MLTNNRLHWTTVYIACKYCGYIAFVTVKNVCPVCRVFTQQYEILTEVRQAWSYTDPYWFICKPTF